jgi:TusA-related sulfurtransferase
MTMDEIKKVDMGEIEVLVDTDTSKENVSRAASSKGWQVKDVQEEGEGYRVIFTKEIVK